MEESKSPTVEVKEDKKLTIPSLNVSKQKQKQRKLGVYTQMIITYRIPISIVNIGDNIKQSLEKSIAFMIEGKCIVEGYIKPGSVKVKTYSSGELNGSEVMFEVVIECLVCCPVENMTMLCVVKNITESAGIKAEIDDGENPSPVIVFLSRDHHYDNKDFSKVSVGDMIKVRVLGQRYELNDEYVSVIGELISERRKKYV